MSVTCSLTASKLIARTVVVASLSAVTVTLAVAPSTAATGPGVRSDSGGAAPVARIVPAAEQQQVRNLDIEKIAKIAKPMTMPATKGQPGKAAAQGADGPELNVTGVLPTGTVARSATSGGTATTTPVTGVLWPGAATANPNRQIGKLYFDIDPSPTRTDWRHCTGTAVNSENKSLIVTAGHCVWDSTNRRWYTNLWFYPGYENGARLGAWPVRLMASTGSYVASGASADDMAIVLVSKNASGVPIVNAIGGHGISFNGAVNRVRTSFGYPVTDSRWPGFTASGEDLYYCQGTDGYYSSGSFAGQMYLGCSMTGGASGGPWLTDVKSTWMGTVNSVNSNKGGTGSSWAGWMFGPYFGSAESSVFQQYRAA